MNIEMVFLGAGNIIDRRTLPLGGPHNNWNFELMRPFTAVFIQMPDVKQEMLNAEERGRQDILDQFRKLTLGEVAELLNPAEYEYSD
jgi:hypothetical protein